MELAPIKPIKAMFTNCTADQTPNENMHVLLIDMVSSSTSTMLHVGSSAKFAYASVMEKKLCFSLLSTLTNMLYLILSSS